MLYGLIIILLNCAVSKEVTKKLFWYNHVYNRRNIDMAMLDVVRMYNVHYNAVSLSHTLRSLYLSMLHLGHSHKTRVTWLSKRVNITHNYTICERDQVLCSYTFIFYKCFVCRTMLLIVRFNYHAILLSCLEHTLHNLLL